MHNRRTDDVARPGVVSAGDCQNRQAARRAAQIIARQFALLEINADIGRPFPERPELRALVISFGDSGSLALHRHEPQADAVYLLAFRHQKEAGH